MRVQCVVRLRLCVQLFGPRLGLSLLAYVRVCLVGVKATTTTK